MHLLRWKTLRPLQEVPLFDRVLQRGGAELQDQLRACNRGPAAEAAPGKHTNEVTGLSVLRARVDEVDQARQDLAHVRLSL